MISSTVQTPAIHELAMRLEQDIRGRGLREGERYLNTVDVGKTFGVSPATAHRAMALLVERKLVVRRNRSGTFISSGMKSQQPAGIQTIHFLTSPEKREYVAAHSGPVIRGFSRSIPKANVQFGFVPAGDGLEYVNKLLGIASDRLGSVGFVCSSCPFDILNMLADSNIPTVVSGTLPLGGPDLPSVALDDFRAGQLLAQYLVEQGHRRIGLLATTLDRPGDKRLFDGIGKPLSQARLLQNSLVFHVVTQNSASVGMAVRHLLEDECRPTAIVARNERLAEMARAAVVEMGLSVPDDIEVVFVDHATDEVQRSPLPHVQTTETREEATVLMGEMLARLSRGETLDQNRVVMPVELCNARTRQT